MSETYTLPVPSSITDKVSGKTFKVVPLGLADLLEVAGRLRDLHLEEAKRQMAGLPIEAVKHFITEARKEAADIQVGTSTFRAKAMGFQGLVFLMLASLQKEDKSVDLAQVSRLFDQDLLDASDKASEAGGFVVRNPTKPVNPAK